MPAVPIAPRLARLPVRRTEHFALFRARTPGARLAGLAGLSGLPRGAALELPRTRSVHTLGMRFPIDLVWLDADGRVVHVDHEVAPWRLRWCRQARSVVECRAGEGVALMSTLEHACRP